MNNSFEEVCENTELKEMMKTIQDMKVEFNKVRVTLMKTQQLEMKTLGIRTTKTTLRSQPHKG